MLFANCRLRLDLMLWAVVVLTTSVASAGVLDSITTQPDVAYSLRRLRDGYAGPAIRVRRGGDNVEADIGFTLSGTLDVAALQSFVSTGGGNGSGFIRTWYNQTGVVALDGVEGLAAEQPQIAAGGLVLTASNGLPAVRFNGGAQNLHALATGGLINKNDVFTIAEYSAQPGDDLLRQRLFNLTQTDSTRLSAGGNDGVHGVAHNNGAFVVTESGVAIVLNETFLSTLIADGTAGAGSEFIRYELNGAPILNLVNATIVNNDNELILGNQQQNAGPRGLNGFIQEFLLYSGSANLSSADRSTITNSLLVTAGLLAVPEPQSIAVWTCVAMGLLAYGLRRRST